MGMNAYVRCERCRRPVMGLDPRHITVFGVALTVAEAWSAHVAECPKTCQWCGGMRSRGRQTCAAEACKDDERQARAHARIDAVEVLLQTTSDPDTIAERLGLTLTHLRQWLRDNGRPDLVNKGGPLAPAEGMGVPT